MIDPQLQEKLRARFNPDGSEIRNLQLRLLEILKYIDRICKENGIKYWLSSGTCLGAVRHGGFIPWDDDVDIEMTLKEFRKFKKTIKKHPDSRFILHDHSSDPEYVTQFPKITDTKEFNFEHQKINFITRYLKYQGLSVDIFIMRPSNSYTIHKITGHIQGLLLFRLNYIKIKWLRLALKHLVYFMLHTLIFPFIGILTTPFSNSTYRHLHGVRFLAKRHRDDFKSTVLKSFEGYDLPIPSDFDSYLHRLFGDYSKLPDIDQLESHIIDINIQ